MKKHAVSFVLLLLPVLAQAQVLDFNGPYKKTKPTVQAALPPSEDIEALRQSLDGLKGRIAGTTKTLSDKDRQDLLAKIKETEGKIEAFQKANSWALAETVPVEGKTYQPLQGLSAGSVEFLPTSLKLNGNARAVSLYVGREKWNWWIPIFLYVGTMESVDGKPGINEEAYNNLLSPSGGLLNLSISKTGEFDKIRNQTLPIGPSGQIGCKLMTAQEIVHGADGTLGVDAAKSFVMLNPFANLGFIACFDLTQKPGSDKTGYLYIQPKVTWSSLGKEAIKKAFDLDRSGFFGYSIEAGAYLSDVVNVRVGWYQSIWKLAVPEKLQYLTKGVLKIGVEYEVKQ